MKFLKIILDKKYILINLILFSYIALNLLDGERGLISYFEKVNIKKQFIEKKESLNKKLTMIENKNNLLTEKVDLDYLEILYRKKFMVGKANEKVYILGN